MKNNDLISAFNKIQEELHLPDYLNQICLHLIQEDISKVRIDKLLLDHNIHPSIAKVDFLHLIFAYVRIALVDDILTDNEKENIKFLKTIFKIQAGDFYYHNKVDIERTISIQLDKIYQDHLVTEKEAELKIGLQEIFDLSFDQMNDYAKTRAAVSIQQGIDPKNLDVFFTYNEYFKLKTQA